MTVEVRRLEASDDRRNFVSGDEALDTYFHLYAGQNQFRHHIGVCYVAVEIGRILGFITVAPASIDADTSSSLRAMPPFPVPVLRVARLAVDQRARGHGLGRALIRFFIELAERMQVEIGCVGLVVDAKSQAATFYERLGFMPIDVLEGIALRWPAPQPMLLPLAAVPRG